MPDNDIDWDEIDRISAEKRRKSLERTGRAISAVMRDSSGIDRLEAITDEEWQAAVEADAAEQKKPSKKPKPAKPKKKTTSRRPRVIDMICPPVRSRQSEAVPLRGRWLAVRLRGMPVRV